MAQIIAPNFFNLFIAKKEARDGDRTLLYKISKTPLFIAIPLFIGSVAFYIIVIEVTKKVCFG